MDRFDDLINEISSYEWEDDLAKIICGSLVNLSELIEDISEEELNIRLKQTNGLKIFECFFEPLIYYKYKHNIYPNKSFEIKNDQFVVSSYLYSDNSSNSLSDLFRYGKTPKVTVKELFDFVLNVLYIGRFNVSSFVVSVINIRNLLQKSNIPICQHNWRPIFITSLILSDKLWDDKCAKNADLAKMVGFISPQVLTHLELVFSITIDWNLTFKLEKIKEYISIITNGRLDNYLIEKVINSEFYQSYCCEDIYESCIKNENSFDNVENKGLYSGLSNQSKVNENKLQSELNLLKRSNSPSFYVQNQNVRNHALQTSLSKSLSFFSGSNVAVYQQNRGFLGTNNISINRAVPVTHTNSIQQTFFNSKLNNISHIAPNYNLRSNLGNLTSPKAFIPVSANKNLKVSQQTDNINKPLNLRGFSLTKRDLLINNSNPITPKNNLNNSKEFNKINIFNNQSSIDEKGRENILQHSASRMNSNPHIFEKVAQSRSSSVKRSSSEYSRLVTQNNNQTQLRKSSLFSHARNTVSSALTSITKTFGFNSNNSVNPLSSNKLPQNEPNSRFGNFFLFNSNVRNTSVPPNSNSINNSQLNPKHIRALSTERSSLTFRNSLSSNNLTESNFGFSNKINIQNFSNENSISTIQKKSQFPTSSNQIINQNSSQMNQLKFSQLPILSNNSGKFPLEFKNKLQFDLSKTNYLNKNSKTNLRSDLNNQNYKLNDNLNDYNRNRFQSSNPKSNESYFSSVISNKIGSQFSIGNFINPISKIIKNGNPSIIANKNLFNSRSKSYIEKIT